MMARMSVVLPTPLRPSTARLPARASSKVMPSSTTASPYPARRSQTAKSVSDPDSGTACSAPEINLAHPLVRGDFLRRALDQNAAADHHDDTFCKSKNEVHIVLDEQDSHILGEIFYGREQVGALPLRHPRRGLVEQQHRRSRRERQRDLQQSLLAIGQLTGRPIGARRQLHRDKNCVRLFNGFTV